MHKILYITSDIDYYDDYAGGGDATLNIKEVTLSQLLEIDEIKNTLKNMGWANIKEIENRRKKVELNKKFFLISLADRFGHPFVREIDIDNLFDVQSMAQCDAVCQEVSAKSILSPEMHKKYLQNKRTIEEQKKKKSELRKKQQEKKVQKEIEKAKKFLEEHSFPPNCK